MTLYSPSGVLGVLDVSSDPRLLESVLLKQRKNQSLIGQDRSRDTKTGLKLFKSNHVTWIQVSDWTSQSFIHLISSSLSIFYSRCSSPDVSARVSVTRLFIREHLDVFVKVEHFLLWPRFPWHSAESPQSREHATLSVSTSTKHKISPIKGLFRIRIT